MSRSYDQRLIDAERVLSAAGLRPVVDATLCRVLANCPVCDASASDPLGMYRPLVVACFGTAVRLLCTGRGCSAAEIRQAIADGPFDWKAVAAEYRAAAMDALKLVDTLLAEQSERPALEMAA